MIVKFLGLIQVKILSSYFYFFDLLTILLFLGVIGKSAQIFLESWLASAMEGPTPVSSLLHASTMIVSGVFLLQRFQSYIFCSLDGMLLITLIGSLTAFFAGTIGLVSMDLKRIIAYSTCSQMGYLVFCVGIGNANISFFHLFNHAFFKCLLFVAAGTLIHALLNEQDIRRMGGLFKLLPFSFVLISVASLSLMGVPFLSGFYSKEKILENAFYIYNYSNIFSFWLGSFSALLTALYSIRLISYSFLFSPNNFKKNYENFHVDLIFYLNIVLFLLGLGTIFSGYLFEDLIIGLGTDWGLFTFSKPKMYILNIHLGNTYINFLTFLYTLFGLFSYLLYNFIFIELYNLWFFYLFSIKNFRYFYVFLGKRWYINLIYNRYIASPILWLGYHETFLLLDKGFFEGISLLSIRRVSDISCLIIKFSRIYYFGEILISLFLVYLLTNGFIILCLFSDFEDELLDFFSYKILVNFFKFSFFFFMATPRKRNRNRLKFSCITLNNKKKGCNTHKKKSSFFIINKGKKIN